MPPRKNFSEAPFRPDLPVPPAQGSPYSQNRKRHPTGQLPASLLDGSRLAPSRTDRQRGTAPSRRTDLNSRNVAIMVHHGRFRDSFPQSWPPGCRKRKEVALARFQLCRGRTGTQEGASQAPAPQWLQERPGTAKSRAEARDFRKTGGPEGIRTLDLSDANRTRSQLRYRPMRCLPEGFSMPTGTIIAENRPL